MKMSSLPEASIKRMQSDDSYAAEEGIEIAVEHWNRDDMEHDRVAGVSIPEHINKCGF